MRTSGRRCSIGRSVVLCSPASGTAGQVEKHPRSSPGTSGLCRGSGRLPGVMCVHSGWQTPCVDGGPSATRDGGYGFVKSVFAPIFSGGWARRDGSKSAIHFSTQESWRLSRRNRSGSRSSPCFWRVYDRRPPPRPHGLRRSGGRQVGSSPPVGAGKMSTRIWWTSTHSRATGRSLGPIHERTYCCSRSRSRESVVSPPMSRLLARSRRLRGRGAPSRR
jgi:hypothetical protein